MINAESILSDWSSLLYGCRTAFQRIFYAHWVAVIHSDIRWGITSIGDITFRNIAAHIEAKTKQTYMKTFVNPPPLNL